MVIYDIAAAKLKSLYMDTRKYKLERKLLYLQNRNFVIELPVHWWMKEMAVLVKIRYKCFLDATLNLLGLFFVTTGTSIDMQVPTVSFFFQ